ncbi:hypothetical protein NQ318_007079 [Aromia moschata]|uniref:chitin synthase n=1 Tax=Aromia moschata TaxID=1265417 RepID=A0AAV8XCI3_9CUCU|nr:hypothetical protein NQ318_007079 [Aromia moschata]
MRRREIYEEDEKPLMEDEDKEHEIKHWDLFRNMPRKEDTGSTAESKYIEIGVRVLKVFTLVMTFVVVLGTAVISKGTLLFMTSQVKKNITRSYCNKNIDTNKQFVITLPEEERVVWIWLIMFIYMVPELGTFIRSVRIICFKSWKYPTIWEFIWLFITESLPAIGSSFLAFIILPELDVIKGAMLTNAVCFVPAVVSFLSRTPRTLNSTLKMVLDVTAIVAQASALVVWPLVEGRPVLYMIPISLLFISVGWWENFVSEKSAIPFISNLAKDKAEFKNKTYFMYAILAPWKALLFFVTTVVVIIIREGDSQFLFNNFHEGFSAHVINITEIEPIVGSSGIDLKDAVSSGYGTIRETTVWTPLTVFLMNIAATYTCYAFGKFTCKIMIQTFSFAVPVNLTVPVILTGLIAMCGQYNKNECAYAGVIPEYLFFTTPSLTYLNDFIAQQYSWIWLIWLLSQTWITIHIWKNNNEKLANTEKLFMKPMYDAFLIDQSVAMNRRNCLDNVKELEDGSVTDPLETNKDKITRIYACGTMWHETKEEMVEFLKSVLRLDEDQCAQRIVRNYLQFNLPSYYEFETHVLFDDAFVRTSQDDQDPHVNQYVLDLIESVSMAASEVHRTNVRIRPPTIYPTPYGGRLVWTLPGKTKMIAHLKDKAKIRAKKEMVTSNVHVLSPRAQVRWNVYLQIMENDDLTPERIPLISENTYILALDGDIDFQPHAVHLLVDYMKKNKTLGAACGRIHPVGSGAMAWYQIFEYAVGHWLQKATEHVIGCVLCSPGCFSLFRAKALMDDNVMAKYTTVSEEARHYVQYDQGEDRWLCTLLLQRGYRVEYSAASDAYTHCPEGFNEFYNQRRRWMPSTTANILDLLTDYKHIVKINDNISKPYILYQIVLMVGTITGPGTIFLMLVGAFVAAFKVDQWTSFLWNLIPILIFVIVCACSKSDTQLFFAGILSGIYGLIMMAVVIGIMMQIKDDGWLAPSSLFFFCVAFEFILTAAMHPQEFYCLKYGVIYYVTVPSMYMLLVIYSIFNMNNVSWGTREVTVVPQLQAQPGAKKEEPKQEKKEEMKNKIYSFFGNPKDNAGSFEFSIAGLIKILCCTHQKDGEENEMLRGIQASLRQLQQKLDQIERNQFSTDVAEPRRTTIRRTTTHIEGSRASRASMRNSTMQMRNSTMQMRNSTMQMGNNLIDLDEEYDDDDSILTPSDDIQENSWFYDGELIRSEVSYLDRKEENFWKALLDKYLHPIDDSLKKNVRSKNPYYDKVAKDLKDLRDRMVVTFFMINALFVLVVFLLTLQKDILHVNWPIDPKVNFTYTTNHNEIEIQKTYLELEPIGFIFLIFFASLMIIQFIAMLYHRFGTFSQIMSNLTLDFGLFESDDVEDLTEEQVLEKDPVKIFKKLIKLQGINDDDEEAEVSVDRRNTVHALALHKVKKNKSYIETLDKAFDARMEKLRNGDDGTENLPVPRKTLLAIGKRRETVQRKSQMLNFGNVQSHFDNIGRSGHTASMTFDNPTYEEETLS